MNWINDFFANYYFITCALAWITSVILKASISSIKSNKKFTLKNGFTNGGMPSSHSTLVSSITFAILMTTGTSSLFFVCLAFSFIILADAFGLRQYVGHQGDQLNDLLKKAKMKPLEVVYGHNFFQVSTGIIWGAGFAIAFYYIFF